MIEEFRKAAPQREWLKETRVGESSDALIDYLTKSIVTSLIATSAPKENDAFGSSISSACNDSDISARLTSVVLGENDMKSTWKGNVSDDESALSIASRASAGRLEAAAEKISYMKKLVKKCREAGLSDVAETPANRSLGIFVNFAATIAFAFDNGVISARQAEKYREINRAGNLANHEF
uniref:Uncharacterized protein n=4 Tax=Tetraselmis chuii TaxID=63592 RepID=A0A7S1X9P7_9CHLO|mmetsp:Transcript_43306/g.77559  ORF Transcript_43306/g.77559 Transcript_43306/m.77559 type:complete len:180 (+) Transcript_43306:558-1097(+)|eukprot:CAMPEP_0177755308 /NCGR_PEP_ID=MMETSP0491_2-20121128/2496_1 /TAXON_ID=63592 /ORGANISM="Tetraselmis chuii, Strain PLY429" /LENGTH=179 /DNA_ID=CAMNT_0019270795 /DNA_START=638 /DNA_END=1177 /DNA_ORIENTATION=-